MRCPIWGELIFMFAKLIAPLTGKISFSNSSDRPVGISEAARDWSKASSGYTNVASASVKELNDFFPCSLRQSHVTKRAMAEEYFPNNMQYPTPSRPHVLALQPRRTVSTIIRLAGHHPDFRCGQELLNRAQGIFAICNCRIKRSQWHIDLKTLFHHRDDRSYVLARAHYCQPRLQPKISSRSPA